MKNHAAILVIAAAIGGTVTALVSGGFQGERPAEITTREAMREKLGFTQKALEGIVMENFGEIEINARKLRQLAKLAGWRARVTPEYELFTNEFRRQTEALADAARERNLDAATLAYTQMTFSCVSCHKYMRGSKISGWDGTPPPSPTVRAPAGSPR
jgi:cytochrome c556